MADSFGVTCRFRFAIVSTAVIRFAIWAIVKPSGKTIRSGFGGGAVETAAVVGSAARSPPPPPTLRIAR